MAGLASNARRRCGSIALVLAAATAVAGPQESVRPAAVPGREQLNYAIEWRLIPAGVAKLTWTPLQRVSAGGGEIRAHLESAGLVSRLFRVEDDYTSLLSQNLCAQSSFMSAHEGNRNKETRIIFDGQGHRATWIEKDFVRNSTSTKDAEIPGCVHDVLGGLMVLRTLRVEPGKTVQIPISDGKKFVQARIESQAREELKTELGTLKTIRYEVFLFNNILYKRAGHLHIWLTDDERRLPVQLQVRLQFTIGTITLRLQKDEVAAALPGSPGTLR